MRFAGDVCVNCVAVFHMQAAEHLHEDQAKYPKRITYSHHVFASPYLAIESLEVTGNHACYLDMWKDSIFHLSKLNFNSIST